MEWNKKLAAEYTESALKIKGRLDELTAQINARRNRCICTKIIIAQFAKKMGGCCGMMLSPTIWTNIVASAGRQLIGDGRVEWNKKLAAEYTESALKIKGRLDELTAQINARRNPKGWIDKETERLLRRRATLYKMYGDTIHIAHILDTYYVDK